MRQQVAASGMTGGAESRQGATASQESALRAAPGRGPRLARVLVMDENRMVRETMRRQLIVLGYEVAVAAESREALAVCEGACREGKPFAVAVLGLLADGGCGGERTLEELQRLDPDLKTLIWGDWLNPRMDAYVRRGGGCALNKPYSLAELRLRLDELLSVS